MFGAAKDVLDWVSLGHLRVGPNSPVIGFLNENEVSGRTNGRSYRQYRMGRDVGFMGVL